jgi:anti-sigma regulatory factor (Ser/Thr protein kinase)/GNAT superfamily N-acetyltransferase
MASEYYYKRRRAAEIRGPTVLTQHDPRTSQWRYEVENACHYSRLTIPNDPSYVKVATAHVGRIANVLGFEEREKQEIESAVSEAVTNVIEHAYEPEELEFFHVSCERVPEGLKVIVRDKGLPFDLSRIPDRSKESNSNPPTGPGSGIRLMQRTMDDVSFHNLGREGKEIHLVKRLLNKDPVDYYEICEADRLKPPEPVRLPVSRKEAFEYRLMRPDEAPEVVACIYKAYGHSYMYDDLYYPERIREMNETGDAISAVAIASDERVAGHCALFRLDKPSVSAEVGQAVVAPEFRGRGCITGLTRFLIEEGRTRGLKGMFLEAVTSHTFSQRVSGKLGFKTCGILLGYAPADMMFKGIAENPVQRESFEIEFLYLEKPDSLKLYPPPLHELFIKKLFKNLGVTPQFAVPEYAIPSFRETDFVAEMKSKTFAPAGFARIEVVRYGEDTIREVETRLRRLCLERIDVIALHLNLRDPITYHLTGEFEKMGFIFAGIMPGSPIGDALILQYLNNVAIDLDRIKLSSEVGRQTLDYLRRTYPEMF